MSSYEEDVEQRRKARKERNKKWKDEFKKAKKEKEHIKYILKKLDKPL